MGESYWHRSSLSSFVPPVTRSGYLTASERSPRRKFDSYFARCGFDWFQPSSGSPLKENDECPPSSFPDVVRLTPPCGQPPSGDHLHPFIMRSPTCLLGPLTILLNSHTRSILRSAQRIPAFLLIKNIH